MSQCPSYILRNRHGTYYFRLVIPKDFLTSQPANSREIRRSLQTSNKKIALQRARLLRVTADQYFDLMRIMPKKKKTFRTGLITVIDAFGKQITVDCNVDSNQELASTRQLLADSYALKSQHVDIREPDNDTGITISQLSEQFLAVKEDRHHLKDRTGSEYRDAHQALIFILGDRQIASLKNEDMEKFYQGLSCLPTSMRSDSTYKEKNFAALQRMKIPPNRVPMVRTREKKFSRVKTLLDYAVNQGFIARNPAGSVLTEKDQVSSNRKREAFSENDIKKIFLHPHFTKHEWANGHGKREPYRFWLPLATVNIGA